jgi:hypothetical protein
MDAYIKWIFTCLPKRLPEDYLILAILELGLVKPMKQEKVAFRRPDITLRKFPLRVAETTF